MNLENQDYERILNTMPGAGVYVIREEDHGILYFNKRAKEVSPEAAPGVPCHELWAGSCACCPLRTIGDRQESCSVGYNDSYGGVVDITAARTLWEGRTPAFVLTVAPRVDGGGYTCRKLLRLDLEGDVCDVLKSDGEGWQPRNGPLSVQLEDLARSGGIHPEDRDRFAAFTCPEGLRKGGTLLYRRQGAAGFRWNLMEVIPDPSGGDRFATLCVKDVHEVVREGREREGLRSQELIRSLGERNSHIYAIDLDTGAADPIRVEGRMQESAAGASWEELSRAQLLSRLHPAYREGFLSRFSLAGLRRERDAGQEKTEYLCQWLAEGEYCYISAAAYFGRDRTSRAVLAIQDAEEQTRQELAYTRRDMQMAAILKSRFKMMNTVDLETGLCERVDLSRSGGPEDTLSGDYSRYIQYALDRVVHPDDAKTYREVLSLDHLREKAETVEDFAEEVCLYRQLVGGGEEEPRWIELRVLYARQQDRVTVNILGQDVTRAKCQEASRLRALEDRAAVISSLSSLFFSTYYINLEQDTFRAVVQLRRVGDVLGEEVDCSAAFQIYANHFVHPEDREEYLRVMNTDHLRKTLRWWNPCVAVEYRMAPEGSDEDRRVRATAVLAQTGPDDTPRTVVYVAQDISGSRRTEGETHG